MFAPLLWLRRERKGKRARPIRRPPVTVVIAAKNEDDNLRHYLPKILEQDYPEYEVIVVDDGSEDNTEVLLDEYTRRYPHLKHTFVPPRTRLISTKKLALTLAAKAAKYDYLLLTDADCRPRSKNWITEMMSGFTEGKSVVLGIGAYFYDKKSINPIIQYDTLFNGLQYTGMALSRHPYMGVGRNLAYKKDIFFQSGGFTHISFTRAGDDDLLVNCIADRRNTAVVITPESITFSRPKQSFRQWLQQKERHLGVSPQYRFSTKLRLTIEPLSRLVFFLELAAVCWFAYYLSLPWLYAVAGGCFLLRWLLQTLALNLSARKMRIRRVNPLLIPLLDIYLPVNNLFLLLHYAVIGKRMQKW